jgi:hypothetical protein
MVSLDPYPDSQSGFGSGSGFRRAKMTHKNRKKVNKFDFLKYWMSLLMAEGFSCSLDIGSPLWRPRSKLQFLIKKRYNKFFGCIFKLHFWSSESWIRIVDPDTDLMKCLIRIRIH